MNLLQVGGFYGAQHLLTVSAGEPPGFAGLPQAAPAPVQVLPDLPAQPPPCARNRQAPSLRSGFPGCARMGVRAALRAALYPGSELSASIAVISGTSALGFRCIRRRDSLHLFPIFPIFPVEI